MHSFSLSLSCLACTLLVILHTAHSCQLGQSATNTCLVLHPRTSEDMQGGLGSRGVREAANVYLTDPAACGRNPWPLEIAGWEQAAPERDKQWEREGERKWRKAHSELPQSSGCCAAIHTHTHTPTWQAAIVIGIYYYYHYAGLSWACVQNCFPVVAQTPPRWGSFLCYFLLLS